MRTMRSSLTGMVILVLLGGSLTAGALAQDEPEGPPPGASDGEPFSGLLTGSTSFAPVDAPTEACPTVITSTDASGPTTLGAMTMHSEHCPTMGMPTIPQGTTTFTTESGDELYGSYFVDCDPIMPSDPAGEPIVCHGRMEFSGGTGQFADATGTAYQNATVWFPGSLETQDWLWVSDFHGMLSY